VRADDGRRGVTGGFGASSRAAESPTKLTASNSRKGEWMKTLAVLLLASAPLLAAEGGMSADERAFLVEQLENSRKEMLASIEGLSAAQWKFKSAPNVWSVQECAEHIILAEDFIFSGAQQVLKAPAVERPAA